ncbi:hypothetical protein B0H11DRAFT_2102988 [Mycena galericulata]|nr:hypothetical protein B0H11DRAFT_2102988 [Mycena galericulata]
MVVSLDQSLAQVLTALAQYETVLRRNRGFLSDLDVSEAGEPQPGEVPDSEDQIEVNVEVANAACGSSSYSSVCEVAPWGGARFEGPDRSVASSPLQTGPCEDAGCESSSYSSACEVARFRTWTFPRAECNEPQDADLSSGLSGFGQAQAMIEVNFEVASSPLQRGHCEDVTCGSSSYSSAFEVARFRTWIFPRAECDEPQETDPSSGLSGFGQAQAIKSSIRLHGVDAESVKNDKHGHPVYSSWTASRNMSSSSDICRLFGHIRSSSSQIDEFLSQSTPTPCRRETQLLGESERNTDACRCGTLLSNSVIPVV